MKFHPTPLAGAYTIDLEPIGDERGFFARMFCREEFQTHDLEHDFVQANNSLSADRGTLRGMHYQLAPQGEVKVVRCVAGSLLDVIVDVREGSPTFGPWFGAELSAVNRRMMYVPRGFAHGFLTLEDNTEAIYLVSSPYAPDLERGLRWDDPAIGIAWPFEPAVLSDRDRQHRDLDRDWHAYRA